MAKRKDGYTDFEDLSPVHQAEAIAWFKTIKLFAMNPEGEAAMSAFKITPAGHVSRRHADRTISTAKGQAIDEWLNKPTRRANDDVASGGCH